MSLHNKFQSAAIAICLIGSIASPELRAQSNTFITLGTNGGPQGEVDRAQPANALLLDDAIYLVDAGDGAAGQLAKAGIRLTEVDGLFLSHLLFDHTGGVLALLGQRAQLNGRETFRVYGPPGTRTFIDGLRIGMQPGLDTRPGRPWPLNVEVVELVNGDALELNGVAVAVAENTHFKLVEAQDGRPRPVSLSYRFDLPDRSIVYTGDTGPSENLVELSEGADLLISEIIDAPAMIARVRRQAPDTSEASLAALERHLLAHHLSPRQAGELASAAGVGSVVLTHISPSVREAAHAREIVSEAGQAFDGNVVLARDLDRY